MNTQELRELDAWIAEHVTKVIRRLSDAEYVEVVKQCEEINRDPHPNLSITQPYRFEGVTPHYTTDPAAAMAVLEKLMHHHGAVRLHKVRDDMWLVQALAPDYNGCLEFAETLSLAICLFAKKLLTP